MAPMSLSRLAAIALLFATPVLLAQRHGGRAQVKMTGQAEVRQLDLTDLFPSRPKQLE